MVTQGLPKISIVTVCKNAESTLEFTIRSVLENPYPHIEYIVVDGGSSDGTVPLIKRYDAGISKWLSEPDHGISDAFNKGISLATGELIGLVSADDYLPTAALHAVAHAYVSNRDVDVLFGNSIWFETPESELYLVRPDRDFRHVWERQVLKHSATYITRDAYLRHGLYDLAYQYAMDYELVLRFFVTHARFLYVDEVMGAFRSGGVNERNYLQTMCEVREISIHYGYPRWRAYLAYYRKAAWLSLKRGLQNIQGKHQITSAYRRISRRFERI